MPYIAVPNNIQNVVSVSLEIMSPEEMAKMSYGEVLTSETINYRTGLPQVNGLFCQAIFGPVKDWECSCGKYKRYRYAGVICDKCGVEVTHSSVRRQRLGHITLAVPCAHPWYLRLTPRIALLLDMKSTDVSKVCYFSAYVITDINEKMREEYLEKIDQEAVNRINKIKQDFDEKFEELSRQYQINKSSGKFDLTELKTKYEADKEILKEQEIQMITKVETIAQMAKKELASLQVKDVVNENIHQELAQKFGPVFKSGIGAEAIETLLSRINLKEKYEQLKEKMQVSKGQTKKDLAKKIKLVKHFLKNNTRPEWMILRRIMVLPPDLRPMLQLDGGRFAASDLNELYRRLINRNNRLRKLIQIGAPEVILRNEKRMLQEAVEALIDNAPKNGKQVMASTGIKRPLKSLTDILKGKHGRFRQNLLGKRVDYSGRSVIIIGPNLKLHQCGLPKDMALELFKPFIIGRIISKSEAGILPEEVQAFNVHSARRLIESKKPIVYDILDEVIKDKYVLLNRAPTLHRLGFLAFQPVLIEGKAIRLHPLVCRAFNADFDGDQMAVHLPITIKGQEEAKNLMAPIHNLVKPSDGKIIMGGHLDIHLGIYYLTAIDHSKTLEKLPAFSSKNEAFFALDKKKISLNQLIRVKLSANQKSIETTLGRIIFNQCFPEDYPFINETVNRNVYGKIIDKAFHELGKEKLTKILDVIKKVAFDYATISGISIASTDLVSPEEKRKIIEDAEKKVTKLQELFVYGLLTENERYSKVIDIWRKVSEDIAKAVSEQMHENNLVRKIVNSGAKGNMSQVTLMSGIRGLSIDATGKVLELPAKHSYLEGLTGLEYFIMMRGARKGMADTTLKTADAGYLTRRLVDVAQNLVINDDDCGTEEGVMIDEQTSKEMNKSIWDRVYGRYLVRDIEFENQVLAKKGDLLDYAKIQELKNYPIKEIWVRSPNKCELVRGICRKCYGIDLATHKPVDLGVAVGIIGAQSLGEPSTQLVVSSVKTLGGSVSAAASNITAGLPRVEELFEARLPKYTAPISTIDGIVKEVKGNVDEGFKITIVSDSFQKALPLKDIELLVNQNTSINLGGNLAYRKTGEIILSDRQGLVNIQDKQIIIKNSHPEQVETYEIPHGVYLLVKVGDRVKVGQTLAEGPLDLQKLMDLVGIDAVQNYIVNQIINIYAGNGIDINEKHIEVVIKQMFSRVQIIDPGDSEFIAGDLVNYIKVVKQNQQLSKENKSIAKFKRVITGISRAALTTDSFLSAASFQETARVLVEAAVAKSTDWLRGLKENVILGQLIPCGTGFNPEKVKNIDDSFLNEEEFEELENTNVS